MLLPFVYRSTFGKILVVVVTGMLPGFCGEAICVSHCCEILGKRCNRSLVRTGVGAGFEIALEPSKLQK